MGKTEIVVVTRAMAREWLLAAAHRAVNKHKVSEYAQSMSAGDWRPI